MANAKPRIDNLMYRINGARELMETRSLLIELLNMPEARLFPLFGVTQWAPQEVHGLKDLCFLGTVSALIQTGWNCDAASFGEGHRDTFLMEMTRRGFPKTVARLLNAGAEADHNSQGYGASTPLMCARDPDIMKVLLYYGANPLAANAIGQTDFTYKLLKGLTPGAHFYLYNSEKIPLQSLLHNFRDCVLSRTSFPYEPMYPLCLVPVVPKDTPYPNVIDMPLVNAMLDGYFLPFSSNALLYQLEYDMTVWQYIKQKMEASAVVIPALVVACIACMAKLEECRTARDFAFLEAYIEKPLPRELKIRETLSKSVFVYLLFSLSNLPAAQLLRWIILLGRLIAKIAAWANVLGDVPFRVSNSTLAADKRSDSSVLQEMATLQALLSMRVNISKNFGEFNIPEDLAEILAAARNVE